MRFRARWVYPGDGPPLPDAVVSIAHGTIKDVRPGHDDGATDLGNVALIPGLINAHTHLEFSHLETPIEPRRNFADWIRSVIAHRQEWFSTAPSSIVVGMKESLQRGVTGLAEIATSDWIFEDHLHEIRHPHYLIFREILGLSEQRVVEQLEIAERFLQRGRELQLGNIGLSPHAPYSLHPQLFRGLCDLVAMRQIPLAMHLAESPSEMMLLQQGTGPLVDLFTKMGLWRPGIIPLGTRPLKYLKELARAPRALIVHGTYLDQEEIEFVAAHEHISVVYCPRTHNAMQSGQHPWRHMLNRGVNVTLGSDSRASNPDLSIWAELQFLFGQPHELPASRLLSLATSQSARALGWENRGRIAVGNSADLCVVQLTPEGLENPEKALFEGTIADVMFNGQWQPK